MVKLGIGSDWAGGISFVSVVKCQNYQADSQGIP
ncbi:hypothetical protein H1P_1060009 [Hyella patelloides LEGE 07179]|uniref:Uncharacterized protein n=1 Tax=Hyella patelloides LEGE 07179 TaxID=945734 RepID=A0A563VJ60_9CYAN|nr:hypothetical protein H1P_1060009 [Hyella patelloides LEGE 07179]